MVKKGDTLIEVTLAIGIFSMVAIAVVAVMSGGTSGTQTALETTIAREEIDAQAEALRFIQSSYIADKDSGDTRFSDIWKRITGTAISATTPGATTYAPTSCADLYDSTKDGSVSNLNAFIINTRKLGDSTANAGDIVVRAKYDTNKFFQTTTYPRILYGRNASETEDNSELVSTSASNALYRAEGIYVVAVKDDKTTHIVTDTGSEIKQAFYDFYIRTCWYGSGADTPSTIATVIRLYDPDALSD